MKTAIWAVTSVLIYDGIFIQSSSNLFTYGMTVGLNRLLFAAGGGGGGGGPKVNFPLGLSTSLKVFCGVS